MAQERKILQLQAISLNDEEKETVMDSIALILTTLGRSWQYPDKLSAVTVGGAVLVGSGQG